MLGTASAAHRFRKLCPDFPEEADAQCKALERSTMEKEG